MPLVMLEAMANGLPVVASDLPELRDLARGAFAPIAGLTPTSIAAAARGLVDDASRQRDLREAGLAVARGHSWDAVLSGVDHVYRDLRSTAG
jgi:glycosyltransferase involved in cell wall biosynthesis